jgi:Acetyltransferase (GNAT) domain
MNWKRFALTDCPANFWEQWDALNYRYCELHPMLQSRFIRPLIQAFPADIDVLAGFQENCLSALILLERSGGFVKRTFLPSQAQIALLLVPSNISPINRFKRALLPSMAYRIDLLSIDPRYQSGLIAVKGEDSKSKGMNMVVDVTLSFEEYWSLRPKNLRKNISRYRNRIRKRLGGSELRVVKLPQEIGLAVDRYGLLESRGWKGRSGTALHPENSQGIFYRNLLESFASTGNATIFELWVDGQLVASRLSIANDQLLIILKTTYREDLKTYAFGRILLFETIKYIFATREVKTIDFYTNASKEQLDWSTGARPLYNMSLYRGVGGALFKIVSGIRKMRSPNQLQEEKIRFETD